MRVHVMCDVDGIGYADFILHWLELDAADWEDQMRPLALLMSHHPNAQWRAVPVPDNVSDRDAMEIR